jgi:hypothetical protein
MKNKIERLVREAKNRFPVFLLLLRHLLRLFSVSLLRSAGWKCPSFILLITLL